MKPPTIPFEAEQRARMAEQWNAHPGMRHMGARADFSDPQAVRVTIDPLESHHRGGLSSAAVNGAVIAGLIDVAIGIVGHCQMIGKRVGTVQLSMHFVRPVVGDSVTVVARLVNAGTNLVFGAAEVLDPRGIVCVRADGIVAVAGSGTGKGVVTEAL
jgi:acyl-coenzyme A thioesterase PaaI-like protein